MARVSRLKRLNARAFEPVPCDFKRPEEGRREEKKRRRAKREFVEPLIPSVIAATRTKEVEREQEKKKGDEKRGGTVHLMQFATLHSGPGNVPPICSTLGTVASIFYSNVSRKKLFGRKKKKGGILD